MSTAHDALTDTVLTRFSDVPLRIGTRTTPMALSQATAVENALTARVPGLTVEQVGITTDADLWHGDLSALGGKGQFVKAIDKRLISGGIDIAVHAMKDVPGDVPLPEGTAIGAYLRRQDTADVLVASDGSGITSLDDLPPGALVGTSAVRRRAQLSLARLDLKTERVRGAVGNRLDTLDSSDQFEALILARAGLYRIGAQHRITQTFPITFTDADTPSFVPAIGSGVIGVQARTVDTPVMRLLDEISDPITARWITAERTALHMLFGHCNSPIAGHCTTTPDGRLQMSGMVFNRDGSKFVRAQKWGPADDPATLGSCVAADLLEQGARRLINATRA